MQSTVELHKLEDVVWAIEREPGGYYGYAWNPKNGQGLLMTAHSESVELARELLKRRLCERLKISLSETLQSATGAVL